MVRLVLKQLLTILALASACAAGAQTPDPPAARSGPITAADFARLPLLSQPQLSPEGSSLAALMAVDGRQAIALLNPFNLKDKPVYRVIPEDTQVAWVRWVNKDNIVVGLYALLPVDGGDRWHISRLIGINRVTGKVTRILWDSAGQDAADVLWIANDGSPFIAVAAQHTIYSNYEEFWPTVWRINVENGKRERVLRGRAGVMNWYADAAGNVRAGVSFQDEGRKFKLLYREPGNASFKQIDTADTRKEEVLLSPFMFLPGTSHALAIHDDAQGRSAVFEVDLLTQKDIRTVYSAPGGGEVDSVFVSANGNTLLGASYSGPTSGIAWFDPALAETQAAIDKAVPGRRARIVSMTADRSKLLVKIDRASNPGAYYYYDVDRGTLQPLATINQSLGLKPLAPVKMVQYKARDGLQIEAVLTLPSGRSHKNLPIVLMPHGGPWGHDTLDYDYWAQFVASRGYVVLQPNFRGSTGYGTEFLRKGQGQMGLAMQDDISDGLAWAVKEGLADPKRACIVGASYGGYAAMWGVAKDPDLYRCAVSIAGVSNMRREVNDFGNALLGRKYRDDWKRMTPDFAAVSPINAIDRIKAPLLLIHGKKDITVDVVQSTSMGSKMRGAGKQVELVVLPEADHYFTREADRLTLLTSLETFLLKHNPPDPAPTVAAAP
jgi:dipeptidyl aminopeptidase/acylaminoacyl peptidase